MDGGRRVGGREEGREGGRKEGREGGRRIPLNVVFAHNLHRIASWTVTSTASVLRGISVLR